MCFDLENVRPATPGRLRSEVDSGLIVVAIARPHPIATGAHARELSSCLDAEEKARHGAFRFARDQQVYLAAHGLMRAMLSECTGVPPRALSIGKDRWGRPELLGPAKAGEVHFSLSHTQGLVACAVSRWAEVGIDVEATARADLDVLSFAGVFTAEERRRMESIPPSARAKEFFSSWTLKEAYSKARGLGLHLSFMDFAFRFVDGQAPQIEFPGSVADDARRWSFWLDAVAPGHVLALASGRPRPQAVVRYAWEARELSDAARFYPMGCETGQEAARRFSTVPTPDRAL
jgi:4'-phosphopantetheinyl transferase